MTAVTVEPTEDASTTMAPRTQASRREATRRRFLDAAVACLTERGYAATTVVEIQQRAGISRGALQHYWPSRAALIVDAVKALFDSMAAHLRAEMRDRAHQLERADAAQRIRVAIELLWASFDSALFRAELELWVAARHDAELRPLVVDHDRQLAAEILRLCRDMFGSELAAHPKFTETIHLLVYGMRGAGLVADLHPAAGSRLVGEWQHQICDALDVPMDRLS